MLEKVAKTLVERGYKDVRADFPGFTEPIRMIWKSTGKGHIPDVTGYKDGLRFFKIETVDSVVDEHTADKWKLFSSYAETNNALFYLVLPKGALGTVKKKLQELNLRAHLWVL
jgi:hypothetical protein